VRIFSATGCSHTSRRYSHLDDVSGRIDEWADRFEFREKLDNCDRGNTIFLSTHFIEVAEQLCTRVAIGSDGRLVAERDPSLPAAIRGFAPGWYEPLALASGVAVGVSTVAAGTGVWLARRADPRRDARLRACQGDTGGRPVVGRSNFPEVI
jgi:hypothetical protein